MIVKADGTDLLPPFSFMPDDDVGRSIISSREDMVDFMDTGVFEIQMMADYTFMTPSGPSAEKTSGSAQIEIEYWY